MIRTLVHGAGRMAQQVLAQLQGMEKYQLLGMVSRSAVEDEASSNWFPSLQAFGNDADLLIDFTLPGGTRTAAQWCAKNGVALLSGTTGLSDEDIDGLKKAGLKVPVLWAPNLSQGVALMSALVRQAASVLGAAAETSITDIHHQHKIDSPSGTALALAGAVMAGRPDDSDGELVFSSIREGEVIGEHSVRFELPDEVIEISHKALDRRVFAAGALKAGAWLVEQDPGYYSTSDWLGLM